jgi:hypothetical protein
MVGDWAAKGGLIGKPSARHEEEKETEGDAQRKKSQLVIHSIDTVSDKRRQAERMMMLKRTSADPATSLLTAPPLAFFSSIVLSPVRTFPSVIPCTSASLLSSPAALPASSLRSPIELGTWTPPVPDVLDGLNEPAPPDPDPD